MSSHRRRLFVLFASMFLVLTIVIGSSVGLAASKTKDSTWAGVDEANELQEILDRLNAKLQHEIIQESGPAEYDTAHNNACSRSRGDLIDRPGEGELRVKRSHDGSNRSDESFKTSCRKP